MVRLCVIVVALGIVVHSPQQEKKGRAFMNVGYARCSTVEQNEERQLRMMAERVSEVIQGHHTYLPSACFCCAVR